MARVEAGDTLAIATPTVQETARRPRLRSELLLNSLQTLAILVGLIYGGIQLADLRAEQRRQANIELARSFMTPEFNEGMAVIRTLPADASAETIGPNADRIVQVMQTFEVVGVLVHEGDVDLRVANEFLGGGIVGSWRRLQPFVEDFRAQTGNPRAQEWFQWLAERLIEYRERSAAPPAYERYRDWEDAD
jgi:hypothetical protein